jgi:hypothetical protein
MKDDDAFHERPILVAQSRVRRQDGFADRVLKPESGR